MRYRIVNCQFQTGERYRMLVDAQTDLPPWWPMLYITTQVRNAGRSVATMEATLAAIQVLHSYTEEGEIDLSKRILSRQYLAPHELDALCDLAQRNFQARKNGSGAARRATVSRAHHYNRLSRIAEYLEWYAHMLLDNRRTRDDDTAIRRVVTQIRARRPPSGRRDSIDDRALSQEGLDRLREVIMPDHPENPFEDSRTAERNALAIRLMLDLGVRRGELLSLEIGDIDWQQQTVRIRRKQDNVDDPRKRQPVTKTEPRKLNLFPELLQQIHDYVMGPRSSTRGARTHRYLLVTHRKGPHEGQPLSESGLQKIFERLKRCDRRLENLHAHALRHTWNWQFSQGMDRLPKEERPTLPEQEATRNYNMGWRPGSGTGAAYNQRHIQEKAGEAALRLQQRMKAPNASDN